MTVAAVWPCSPVFTWFVWCWPCRRAAAISGVALRGTPASPATLPPDGYTHEDSSRQSHRTDVVRAPLRRGSPASRMRARRRSENPAGSEARRPGCHRSRKCRRGGRAGVGGARHRSRKLAGLLGGAAAATSKRNVEVSPGREEGRRRMLGESDGRRAHAGTGRPGSPPGVCLLFPPGLLAGSRAWR